MGSSRILLMLLLTAPMASYSAPSDLIEVHANGRELWYEIGKDSISLRDSRNAEKTIHLQAADLNWLRGQYSSLFKEQPHRRQFCEDLYFSLTSQSGKTSRACFFSNTALTAKTKELIRLMNFRF